MFSKVIIAKLHVAVMGSPFRRQEHIYAFLKRPIFQIKNNNVLLI